ncbi:MAG: orotidine 5'-phosphate decarboxylase [Nitrospirae bacterium RIFCSPLOWO2_02_42_7]|nr:MAG: orotidine 5'-phosphate decarboxylase [Nitrospirae bacterium RIFCSPLOWO2_02_42_7]
MSTKIIFPLDFSELKQALMYVGLLKDHVSVFKIGLELFVNNGPAAVKGVLNSGGKAIFLDLKFHDIPETVRRAIKSPIIGDVDFITVHSSDGPELLSAAVKSVPSRTKVLAVTVLTSLSEATLKEQCLLKENITIKELVIHRAKMARDTGCSGIVCSGLEIIDIREQFGRDFITVVPGVRPLWSLVIGDDQRRIVTPRDAAIHGADYIVIGRPIRDAKDPVEAAQKILSEIESAGPN